MVIRQQTPNESLHTFVPPMRFDLTADEIPTHWYNIMSDLPFELPPDLPPERYNTTNPQDGIKAQVPLELIRQSISKRRDIQIPEQVRSIYQQWRPTPLYRATRLEAALQTPAHIYYKYEGNNSSGSHKLNTAIAQAYYYKQAGIQRLTTGTGAGQWGTALAMACHTFGMQCKVYMVDISYQQKPYRKVMMQMYDGNVVPSPSLDTRVGAEMRKDPNARGNLAFAITEALEDALSRDDTRFCVGSGEAYSILHQTIIGLEARAQMQKAGEMPDVVIASMGAGSNFGGISFPFLRDRLLGQSNVRCISVEPSACPKLTRGTYRYDATDSSGVTPLQKMYTLGQAFIASEIHAGGLRYHACAKIISALYYHHYIEAVAYQQPQTFQSGVLFSQLEGIVPAPESAHAVHGAIMEAVKARTEHTHPVILFCLSGHGLFDMSAYDAYLQGKLQDVSITDAQIAASLAELPVINEL